MDYEDKWKDEIGIIEGIIEKFQLDKSIKWGSIVYNYKGKNLLSYGGFKHYCALWFYNGVFLSDSYKVLINAQEGKTKSLRQWRFTSKDEIDESKISEYILEAIEVEEKGMKIVREKLKMLDIPAMLQAELDEDVDFESKFKNLTPGRQNEYIDHINQAKQEGTRLKRLTKIKPMILNGVGLNDKYKQN